MVDTLATGSYKSAENIVFRLNLYRKKATLTIQGHSFLQAPAAFGFTTFLIHEVHTYIYIPFGPRLF